MRKLLLLIGFVFTCSTMFGQRITSLDAVTTTTNSDLLMIRSGASGNKLSKITWGNIMASAFGVDSINVDVNGNVWFFLAGDTLKFGISDAGSLNLFDYAARKFLTDTLHITAAADTMEASWAGKVVNCTHATFQNITILANTMAVGSVVTFVKYGAGPVKVTPAAGVTRSSVLDSTTMNTVKQTYQIEFRTANKPLYIGDWKD